MPFRSAVKTGMITASLTTSQASISPAKSPTSRRIRATCRSRISSTGSSVSHRRRHVCQHSGWPLTCDASVDEPAGGGAESLRVGMAALGLEPAPVERQRGRVEELEPVPQELFRRGSPLPVELAGRQLDRLEAGAAEPERVVDLGDNDVRIGQWRAVRAQNGQLDVGAAVLVHRAPSYGRYAKPKSGTATIATPTTTIQTPASRASRAPFRARFSSVISAVSAGHPDQVRHAHARTRRASAPSSSRGRTRRATGRS